MNYQLRTDKTDDFLFKTKDTNSEIQKISFNFADMKYKVYDISGLEIASGEIVFEIPKRWMSLDPKSAKYPGMSPYNGMGNNPILMIDPDGKEHYVSENGKILKDRKITDPDDPTVFMITGKGENEVKTNIGRVGGDINITTIMKNILQNNAPIARKIEGDYKEFYNKVATGKFWDYKKRKDMVFSLGMEDETDENNNTSFYFSITFGNETFSSGKIRASDVGNFHAGFVGKQAGFSDIDLFLGAGMAEIAKDAKPWKYQLRSEQIDQLLSRKAPYGDEVLDYKYNKMGMNFNRLWNSKYGINIKERSSTIMKVVTDVDVIINETVKSWQMNPPLPH